MAILSGEEILAIVLFLVLSLIFIFTVLALLRDGLRTTTNRLMLAFITLMYLASAATFCVEITTLSRLLKELEQEDPAHEYMDYRFQSSSMRTFLLDDFLGVLINAIFGDGIILWRVLAIWPRSKLAKRVSIALYILLVASSLAGIICLFALPTAPTYLVFLGISLVSNLWATIMIGIRAWQFRKMLRRQVTIISRKSVLEKALILLAESGIVYCVLWAAYFVLFLCLQFGTYYDFLLSYIQMYFSIILWFFVPMYPMLIVLLVSRRKSVLEDNTLTSIEAVTKLDLADNSVEYAELGNRSNEPHWTSEPFLEYKYEEILPSLARPTP